MPNLLSWWRNKNRDNLIRNHVFPKTPNTQRAWLITLKIALRLSAFFAWCSLACGPILRALTFRDCEPRTSSPSPLSQNVHFWVKLFSLVSHRIPPVHCGALSEILLSVTLSSEHFQWIASFCLFAHFALLVLQTYYPNRNPFFFLVDAIFLVLSAYFVITSPLSRLHVIKYCLIGSSVLSGGAVLIFRWLPYACDDFVEQKKKLASAWPCASTSIYTPSVFPPSYANSLSPNSQPSSSDETLLHFNRLSINGRTTDLSAANPQRSPQCYSAIFSPPALGSSFSRLESPHPLSCYAVGTTSGFGTTGGYGRRLPDDTLSHFTSVSQLSDKQRSASEKPVEIETDPRRRGRRGRRNRPQGLLRWTLYLLFGRLETWEDVKSELTCLLNAVLVGVLLLLIGHMFYTIVPALWGTEA